MKLALYYPWVYLTSGAERLILELTGNSKHEWTIFTNRYDQENTYPEFKYREIIELKPRISVKRDFSAVIGASYAILKQKLPLHNYDALIVVCEGIGDLVTVRNKSLPIICICLTPLRAAFDPFYQERYLDGRGLLTALKLFFFAKGFRLIDKIVWKKYCRIFCISQEVRRRVVNGGLAKRGKIEIVYPGIKYLSFNPSWRYDHYFLIPGRIMWTKNIGLGIKGFNTFLKKNPDFNDFRLIIAGIVDEKSKSYFASLKSLALNDQMISFICRPSDETLFSLYRDCYCVLFTAFNEDWGIVPLEAMAFGKPVISVNRGGPTESIIDGVNGFLVEPNPEDFAEAMRKLVSEQALALEMGKAGRSHCRKYDWAQFVRRIDNYIEEVKS